MVKTKRKHYSIQSLEENSKSVLAETINYRQAQFTKTVTYHKINNEIIEIIEIIKSGTVDKVTIGGLLDAITALECETFDAGYMSGMADVMTSITFNEAQITAPEYVVFDDNRLLGKSVSF